ncbi:hypothetical protein ABW20_dc0106365 [Dactylellina cionopaga]|nr:hypothetical protein ABW20_dc0106365 [Dactylellina cionopaga]
MKPLKKLIFMLSILLTSACSRIFVDARVPINQKDHSHLIARGSSLSTKLGSSRLNDLLLRAGDEDGYKDLRKDLNNYGADFSIPPDEEPDSQWLSKVKASPVDLPESGSSAWNKACSEGAKYRNFVTEANGSKFDQVVGIPGFIADAKNGYEWEGDLDTGSGNWYYQALPLGDFVALEYLYQVATNYTFKDEFTKVSLGNDNGLAKTPYVHLISGPSGIMIIDRADKHLDKSPNKLAWSDVLYATWERYATWENFTTEMKESVGEPKFFGIGEIKDPVTIEVILESYKQLEKQEPSADKLDDANDFLGVSRMAKQKQDDKDGNSQEYNVFNALLATPLTKGITKMLAEHRTKMNSRHVDYILIRPNKRAIGEWGQGNPGAPRKYDIKFQVLLRLSKA